MTLALLYSLYFALSHHLLRRLLAHRPELPASFAGPVIPDEVTPYHLQRRAVLAVAEVVGLAAGPVGEAQLAPVAERPVALALQVRQPEPDVGLRVR